MILVLWMYGLLACLSCALVPRRQRLWMRRLVWVLGMISVYLSWLLLDMFDDTLGGFQLRYGDAWALDAYSLWLVVVTLWITPMVAIMSEQWMNKGLKEHRILIYTIQLGVLSALCTLDAFIFLVSFQAIIVPVYLLIMAWGGEARREAGMLWLIYQGMGFVCMNLAYAFMGHMLGSFMWTDWILWSGPLWQQQAYFIAVSLAMMMQCGMFPFHIWLPTVYTQAPSGASVILASVVAPLGAYGWLRWGLPVAPQGAYVCAPFVLGCAMLSLILFCFIALVQKDMKRLLSYASAQRMAWVVLAIFVPYLGRDLEHAVLMLDAAMLLLFAQAVTIAGLFLSFGMIYQRMHRRDMTLYGGLASTMPFLSFWSAVYVFAWASWPGTINFLGVWVSLLGMMHVAWWLGLLAAVALVGSAGYMLWMYGSVFWGPVRGGRKVLDLSVVEMTFLSFLVFVLLFFGFYPGLLARSVHSTSMHWYPYFYAMKVR